MPSRAWPSEWIVPAWPVPASVKALVTTRTGAGESRGAFGSRDGGAGLNLGLGSGDERAVVSRNRAALAKTLGVDPVWLNQVHGTSVVKADRSVQPVKADAIWTDEPGLALGILVADCLPVLFADRSARVVAAAHAGWRGLANGVLENAVHALPVGASDLVAYFGPCIGAEHFEVGEDVFHAFVDRDARSARSFVPRGGGKWMADLQGLARTRLIALDVEVIANPRSTVGEPDLFYSYRRDKRTGRMAAVIWLEPGGAGAT